MNMFFAASTQGFYDPNFRHDYDAAQSWPADAVEVDPETEARLRAAIQAGAVILALGEDWEITPAPFAGQAAERMDSFRRAREIALNRLSGIGFAALLAGDTEHAQEVSTVRAALLDIPALPAVSGADSAESLATALSDAWLAAYRDTSAEEIATAMAVGAGGGQTRPPT